MAQNEQVRIDIDARDNASKKLDDVADAVKELERADVDIPVDADTRQAERAIADVDAEARALTDADRKVVIKAQIDDLRGELRSIGDEADTTKRKLEDVTDGGGRGSGRGPRGQAISDLTGPLGEVSTTASDLSGVFDGVGDTIEGFANKAGVDVGGLVGAIGGIGFAVTAAATAWSYFRQQQDKARERQKELVEGQRKLNELIEKGEYRDAAKELIEMYSGAYDAAKRAGVSAEDYTRFLTGASNVLPTLNQLIREHTDAQTMSQYEIQATADVMAGARDEMVKGRDAYLSANGSIRDQDAALRDVQRALTDTRVETGRTADEQARLERAAQRTEAAFDRLSGALDLEGELLRLRDSIGRVESGADTGAEAINQLKQDILNLAEEAGANPIEVRSTLEKVDAGDLAGVRADVESYYKRAPVVIATRMAQPPLGGFGGAGSNVPTPDFLSAAPTVNVTQNFPRGWHGDARVAVDRSHRRAGNLYGRRG